MRYQDNFTTVTYRATEGSAQVSGGVTVVDRVSPAQLGNERLHPLGGGGDKAKGPPITRTVLASVHLLHGEKKILTSGEDPLEEERAVQKDNLLRRIALGRAWARDLVDGNVGSPKALAQRERKSESYVYDVLRAGCLSPEIVEQLIHAPGRTIGLDELVVPLPVSWTEHALLVKAP